MGVTIKVPGAVGAPIGATYVTLSNDATLTAERVLTAGAGIDITDAGANLTVTISGENASTTNKGIASFNSNNFSVSAGAVSLGTQAVDFNMGDNSIDNVDDLYVRDIFHPTGGEIDVFDSIDMNSNNIVGVEELYLDALNAYSFAYITQRDPIIVYTSGVIYRPAVNGIGDIGSSSYKFDDIWCIDLHEGDHIFYEKSCPLCDTKFKAGEAIINYVLSNTKEGTRTIPAHLTCAIKSENQTKKKHGEVIQKLKDAGRYIDPIKKMAKKKEMEKARELLSKAKKKEMEAKLKAKQDAKLKAKEVKMQKITLEDGKKALLVSQGSTVKVYSEEQIKKEKERLTKELAEVQKFLDELNKK